MRIYIAGPITGVLLYKDKFDKAEDRIKELGHIAINPAFLPEGLNHYMKICLAMLDQADAILLLKGWEQSKGACEELDHAIDKGKVVFHEEVLWE